MLKFSKKLTLVLCLSLVPLIGLADKYQDTVATFRENSNAVSLLKSAYGYAVFPNIGKGGFGIGAAYGRGKVFVQGAVTGAVSMKQLTIGFQLGGQAYSQIILFKDKRAYTEFTSGSFEFGAQATAVAITMSASAEASTKGVSVGVGTGEDSQAVSAYYKGMAVFTLAKGGLMYEASVGGQKFKFKSMQNRPGSKDLTTENTKEG